MTIMTTATAARNMMRFFPNFNLAIAFYSLVFVPGLPDYIIYRIPKKIFDTLLYGRGRDKLQVESDCFIPVAC
jgi:hypothetical protein